MFLKYVNINVNSEFLILTNAMAFTKIIKHPVKLQACFKHAASMLQGLGPRRLPHPPTLITYRVLKGNLH